MQAPRSRDTQWAAGAEGARRAAATRRACHAAGVVGSSSPVPSATQPSSPSGPTTSAPPAIATPPAPFLAPASGSRLALFIGVAIALRIACFVAMNALAVWAEARPAPSLPDLLLARIPYQPWVERWNYLLWALVYLPVALALLVRAPHRFVRYNLVAGVLSLLRGACIALTGLGPAHGPDLHAGMSAAQRDDALLSLLSLGHLGASPFALTKDLFFSGHTSTTFLLLLYVWRDRWLRWPALVGHALVLASVFLAHLHYSIDVVGAYFATFAVYCLWEWRPR